MGRKLTRRGAIDKCLTLWSLVVRTRDRRCLLCGRQHGKLDAHHGVTPRGSSVGLHWFMLRNGFSLCFQCHQLVHSKRGDKAALEKWLKLIDSLVPQEVQTEIMQAKHKINHFTIDDLEGIYDGLMVEYDKLVKEKGELT